MKSKQLRVILLAFTVSTLTFCSKEDTTGDYCFVTTQAPITQVTGDSITAINVPLVLQVSYNITNGCGSFSRFIESNGFPKEIIAEANYDGCVCTEIFSTQQSPYTFSASQPGEYILRFSTGNSTGFVTRTITVTQ